MKAKIREYGSTLYVRMPMAKNGKKQPLQKTKSLFSQQLIQTKLQKLPDITSVHYATYWHLQISPYHPPR